MQAIQIFANIADVFNQDSRNSRVFKFNLHKKFIFCSYRVIFSVFELNFLMQIFWGYEFIFMLVLVKYLLDICALSFGEMEYFQKIILKKKRILKYLYNLKNV